MSDIIDYKFVLRYLQQPHRIMYSRLKDQSYYKTYEIDGSIKVEEITLDEWSAALLHHIISNNQY